MSHSTVSSGQLTHPIMKGWLQKRSRHMKQWRKRWVILQEFGLYTFKNDTNIISQATEVIDLHNVIYVKASNDLADMKTSTDISHCFEIYCNDVTFIFNAESIDIMHLWIQFIQRQLFKTYLNTNSHTSVLSLSSNANKKFWVCMNCAYQNIVENNGVKTCEFCGNHKPQNTKIVSPSPQLRPKIVERKAEIEEKKSEIKTVPPKSKEKRWQCKICTYDNLDTLPFCEICGTQRPKQKRRQILNVLNLSAQELEQKISEQKKCTFNYLKCPCINRIISILVFYQKWVRNKQNIASQQAFDLAVYQREIYGNNAPLLRLNNERSNDSLSSNVGIYEFINETLENYNNTLLINDFNHILGYHCGTHREIEEITKNIMGKYITNACDCSLQKCLCLQRNHRSEDSSDKYRQLYFDHKAESNEVVTQQILDRIHCRLVHSFELYQFRDSEYHKIRNTHSLNSHSVLHLNHNRLKCIKDIMSDKCKNLLKLRGKNRITNSKYTTQIRKDASDNASNASKVTMEFGKKCHYWKFYGSKQWYILKKYANLKTELLNNLLKQISLIEYKDLYAKCVFLSKCNQCKMLRTKEQNIETFKYYSLNKNESFQFDHIMAMLLYCNNDVLCNIFLKSYPTNDNTHNTVENVHREYAHWARLMREIGECFGNDWAQNSEKNKQNISFYHGINNQQLLFGETIRFNMPKSVTNKLSVALQYIGSDGELLIEIERNTNVNEGIYYFSTKQCEIFSDFPSENENIFVGGHQSLKLKSVLNTIQCENYKVYLSAIHYFQQLIIGQNIENTKNKLSKSIIFAFKNLIKTECANEEDEMKSERSIVPTYICNLFHFITHKTNHKITIKIDDLSKNWDRQIKDLFVSRENNWCQLRSFMQMFPNVEKFRVERMCVEETTMVQLYTFCANAMLQHSHCKLNEVVFVECEFKIDCKDKTYLRQIKAPFQTLSWNISLDFDNESDSPKGMIRLWK